MAILYIIGIIVLFGIIMLIKEIIGAKDADSSGCQQKRIHCNADISNTDEEEDEDDERDSDIVTSIAGINYRCDEKDIGGFIGTAVPENDNKYDSNAVAIYRHTDKKLLGYLPRNIAKVYRELLGSKITPCAGYIIEGDFAPVRGKIKIFDPSDESAAETELRTYIKWMVDKFGDDFCPPEINLSELE